jgi:hypothetical protein
MALIRQKYANLAAFPGTGTADVIYIDESNGNEYIWNGTTYVAYSPANIGILNARKTDAWFTANPNIILGNGQKIYLSDGTGLYVDAYKIGDGLTTLENLDWKGLKYNLTALEIGSVINGAASATPNDTDLVISVESSVAKKNTWTQIKTFLKTYFDTIYTTTSAVASQISSALSGYLLKTLTTSSSGISRTTTIDRVGSNNFKISKSFDDQANNIIESFDIEINDRDITLKATSNNTGYVSNLKLEVDKITFESTDPAFKIKTDNLTASQIVETDASKNLVSAAKGTAYNKNFGTTSGTVREGDKGVTVIYRDFTASAALTGTTAITLINSALIPANTVAVNDEVQIYTRALRDTSTGTATNYLYYNTTNSLSGATLLATQGAAISYFGLLRNLFVKASNNTEVFDTTLIAGTDYVGTTATINSLNINWTNDVYIIHAFTNAAVGNTTNSRGIIIKRSRL